MNEVVRFYTWNVKKRIRQEKIIVIIDDNKFKAQFYLEMMLKKCRERLKVLKERGIIKDIRSPATKSLVDRVEVNGLVYSRKTIKNALRFLRNI